MDVVKPQKRPWWYMWEGRNSFELQPLRSEEDGGSRASVEEEPINSARRSSSLLSQLLYSEGTPRELQLLRRENIGLLVCYLVVGTMQGLVRPLLNVYPIDLGANEAQQTTLSTIATLPAAFKLMYGFLSDNVPIMGYRRKPYMLFGWLLTSFCMMILMSRANLTMEYYSDEDKNGKPRPPIDSPSIQLLTVVFFPLGLGMWLADVMADSLVAQKARLELAECKGQLQSSCYATRFLGLVVAAPISNLLYSHYGPAAVVKAIMVVPLSMVPLIYLLHEEIADIPSTKDQCREIFKTTCKRSVWQPMAFVFLFNLFQVSNAAWRQYLQTVLHFSAAELNDLLIASYVLLYLGITAYKYLFLKASWRYVFLVCMLLNIFVSGMQLALIKGWTFGLSPFWFALGDDAFAEFLQGIQFLPITMMMVELCPVGSEGASYAMFTTTWNSAMMMAPAISTLLLRIWDVSKSALENGQVDGLFRLSVLTTLIQASPILILGWLPHGRNELLGLQNLQYSGSAVGGITFLVVVIGSMVWTMVIGLLNVFRPGWNGSS